MTVAGDNLLTVSAGHPANTGRPPNAVLLYYPYYNAEICLYMGTKGLGYQGYFQFGIILNVLVSPFRFI